MGRAAIPTGLAAQLHAAAAAHTYMSGRLRASPGLGSSAAGAATWSAIQGRSCTSPAPAGRPLGRLESAVQQSMPQPSRTRGMQLLPDQVWSVAWAHSLRARACCGTHCAPAAQTSRHPGQAAYGARAHRASTVRRGSGTRSRGPSAPRGTCRSRSGTRHALRHEAERGWGVPAWAAGAMLAIKRDRQRHCRAMHRHSQAHALGWALCT